MENCPEDLLINLMTRYSNVNSICLWEDPIVYHALEKGGLCHCYLKGKDLLELILRKQKWKVLEHFYLEINPFKLCVHFCKFVHNIDVFVKYEHHFKKHLSEKDVISSLYHSIVCSNNEFIMFLLKIFPNVRLSNIGFYCMEKFMVDWIDLAKMKRLHPNVIRSLQLRMKISKFSSKFSVNVDTNTIT